MGLPVLGTTADIESVLARHAPDVVVVSSERFDVAALVRLQLACERAGTPLKQMQFRLTDVELEPLSFATGAELEKGPAIRQ